MEKLLAVVWLVLSVYVLLCILFRLPPFRSRRKALFIGVPASFVVMVFLALNFPLSDRAGQATASSAVTAANGCQSARKVDPGSASNIDPLIVHDGECPTGWSWSGLRSPVGRVGETFRL